MYSYVLDDSFFPPVLYYKHSVFPNGKAVDIERSTENLVVWRKNVGHIFVILAWKTWVDIY